MDLRAASVGLAVAVALVSGCSGDEFQSGSGGSATGGSGGTATGGTAGAVTGGSGGVAAGAGGGGGAAAGAGGSGAGGSAGCTCVNVPSGWEGPVTLRDKASTQTCSGDWGITGLSGKELLTPSDKPPAQCKCTCDESGASCASPSVALFADAACTNGCGTPALDAACHSNAPSDCNGGAVKAFKLNANVSGSCAKKLVVTKPPLQYPGSGLLCNASAALPACSSGPGVCAPPPTGGVKGICIHQTGDVPCPNGFVARRLVLYTSETDTRDCNDDCKCGLPSCGGVALYSDQQCAAAISAGAIGVPNGQCIAAIGSAGAYKYTADLGCNAFANTTAPKGEVTQKDPITVCCGS